MLLFSDFWLPPWYLYFYAFHFFDFISLWQNRIDYLLEPLILIFFSISSACPNTFSRFLGFISFMGIPAYTDQGLNLNFGGTKLKAPIETPSGILLSGRITLLEPTPQKLPIITSPFTGLSFRSMLSGFI